MTRSIAILNASRKNDGITSVMRKTSNMLKASGYEVKWYQVVDRYTMKSLPEHDCLINGFKHLPQAISMGLTRSMYIAKRFKPDKSELILISEPTLINLVKGRENFIVRFHDFRAFTKYSDKFLTRLLYKKVLRNLKRIKFAIFSTEYVKSEAEKFEIRPQLSIIIRDRSDYPPVKEHLNSSLKRIRGGKITISCISTDRPYKNLHFFLQIARLLENRSPGLYNFLLVTNPKKELSMELEAFGKIEIVQNVDDIGSIYDRTDIIVIPSKYEGFGLPLIEAAYYGIPPVLYCLPPFTETLGNYELFQNSYDEIKWAESIEGLCDPQTYERMSTFVLNRAMEIENDRGSYKLKDFIDSVNKECFS
jgi:glycosyltransferase involved in cell wall biosynthesis